MTSFNFILMGLAVWRISYMLVNEDGPFEILVKIRRKMEFFTTVMECVWCTSVWMGLLASLYSCLFFNISGELFLPYAFAYSAVSIIITVVLERVQSEE